MLLTAPPRRQNGSLLSALELRWRHGFSRSAYNKRYAPHAPQRGKAEYGFFER